MRRLKNSIVSEELSVWSNAASPFTMQTDAISRQIYSNLLTSTSFVDGWQHGLEIKLLFSGADFKV